MNPRSLVLCAVVLAASAAGAEEVFPWTTEQKLVKKDGALTWTVQRSDGEVAIEGRHPKWSVSHKSGLDGSPRETVKTVGDRKTRIVWNKDGAEFTWRVGGKEAPKIIQEKGLWDGDSADARLAGVKWAEGKKVRFRMIDSDSDVGEVYPMVAEYQGLEKCDGVPCHHVKLSLDDFRRLFAPSFNYWFGAGPGAPYLKHENKEETFTAKP